MKRIAFLVGGFTCVVLGVLGVILPVMPGIIFFVFAAYFFSHSSVKMQHMLYKIPYIGKAILDWDMNRRMGRQVKMAVISLFFGMAVYPYLMGNKAYAIIMTNFFFISVFTVLAISENGAKKN